MSQFLNFLWEVVNTPVLWEVVNTPAGITAMAGVLLWALNHAYAAKPAWVKWEGTIISAIRTAEKQIPDSTGNSGLKKLDLALDLVIRIYEAERGKSPSQKIKDELREGIQILHNKLDESGVLIGRAGE